MHCKRCTYSAEVVFLLFPYQTPWYIRDLLSQLVSKNRNMHFVCPTIKKTMLINLAFSLCTYIQQGFSYF